MPPEPGKLSIFSGRRIAIIGTSGSGKTSLAQNIAQRLNIQHIELDQLHWEPDWQEALPETFRNRVVEHLQADMWVVDGNYSKVRDIVWARCDTLIWLDYDAPIVFWRLFTRTMRRIVTQEPLWAGNREDWRVQFLTADSIFLWAWNTYPEYRREFPGLIAQPEYSHLNAIRFSTPDQCKRWVESIKP